MKTILKGFNPWVVVFVGMAGFHIWRQSPVDVTIFAIAAALILSQVFGATRIGFRQQPKISVWAIAVVTVASAVILFLAPRSGALVTVTLLALVIIGLVLLFYRDFAPHPKPTRPVLRARIAWSIWALVFALVEWAAYLGARSTGSLEGYPTISVLLDAPLDEPLGRAIFVVLWLMAGVYLFGVRRTATRSSQQKLTEGEPA
jgi:hypothetical protein